MCTLAIVVPCFNEEEVLPSSLKQLVGTRTRLVDERLISPASTITFVDDGSTDGTWRLIEQMSAIDPCVHGIKLTRNRGHQNALLAGLLTVEGDAVVSIDADLQDDVATIRDMVVRFRAGAQIVYGIRGDRGSDSAFKRGSAEGYYRLLRVLGVDVQLRHRLLGGRRALLSRRCRPGLGVDGGAHVFSWRRAVDQPRCPGRVRVEAVHRVQTPPSLPHRKDRVTA